MWAHKNIDFSCFIYFNNKAEMGPPILGSAKFLISSFSNSGAISYEIPKGQS